MENGGSSQPLQHIPVLLDDEAVAALAIVRGRHHFGAPSGAVGTPGGAAAARPSGRLLMDRDPEAIAQARVLEEQENARGGAAGQFRRDGPVGRATAGGLDGVLLDLGVSSPQLDDARRGFSFQADAPLDMRMGPGAGESAAQFLARASEAEIADVLWHYGEERLAAHRPRHR